MTSLFNPEAFEQIPGQLDFPELGLNVGDRVRRIGQPQWIGEVVPSRLAGELTVRWDDGPHTYDRGLGDRIASSTWDLLDGPAPLERQS